MPQDSRSLPVGHAWRPIEDLPPGWQDLADAKLHRLAADWTGIRENPGSDAAIAEFSERLKREWAIETGLIERVYTLTRGITEVLIEHGLREELIPSSATDRDPALVFDMLQDHAAAVDGLFDFVGRERQLSTSYIKELHAVLLAHQETASGRDVFGRRVEMPLIRGDYKKRPNNPVRPDGLVHEYCPPEQVAPVDGYLTPGGRRLTTTAGTSNSSFSTKATSPSGPKAPNMVAPLCWENVPTYRPSARGGAADPHEEGGPGSQFTCSLTSTIRDPSPFARNSIRPESTISPP